MSKGNEIEVHPMEVRGQQFRVLVAEAAQAEPAGRGRPGDGPGRGAAAVSLDMTRRPALTHPGDDVVLPGTAWYQLYGSPERDDYGRRPFFAYWHSSPLSDVAAGDLRGTTTRGQVFYADDREHMRRSLEAGRRVFLWPSREEVTAAGLERA